MTAHMVFPAVVGCVICTVHYVLCTMYHVLCAMYFVLLTMYYVIVTYYEEIPRYYVYICPNNMAISIVYVCAYNIIYAQILCLYIQCTRYTDTMCIYTPCV